VIGGSRPGVPEPKAARGLLFDEEALRARSFYAAINAFPSIVLLNDPKASVAVPNLVKAVRVEVI
jgi:hypothetical protein